jgi:hypothetical protein
MFYFDTSQNVKDDRQKRLTNMITLSGIRTNDTFLHTSCPILLADIPNDAWIDLKLPTDISLPPLVPLCIVTSANSA